MSNFRDFRSKNKIKGNSNDTSFVDFGAGAVGKASLDALIKQARKNGSLNLANRNLKLIPNEIYRINSAPSNDGVNINFDGDNESWWENVFLTKLVIVANSITQINEDIALLSNLTYFDMSDNKVEVLPNSICELIQLRHLNISKNLISTLPSNLCNLSLLQQFLSSNNRLVKVPNFWKMSDLECLDVSNNNLGEFPPGIENLRSLRKLNLSHNQIQRISCSFERPIGLRIIDLSHNKLEVFPDEFCVEVEQIYLHVNKLINFPITCLHKDLKELSVTHNNIKTFTEAHISNIPSVTTIAIANNAISELPEKISDLTMLANLDVSNNELRCLPFSLGNMDNLKSLSIEGNPFRAMKRNVIGAGTEVIKEYLRVRNVDTVDKNETSGGGILAPGRPAIGSTSVSLDQTDLRATGVVRLSSLGLAELPEEIFASLQSVVVKEFMLNKNKLTGFPMRVLDYGASLLDLDISNNQMTELPASIDLLKHLRRLNISNNKIHSLPESISSIGALIHLAASYNPLGPVIPAVVYRCTLLQSLHMSHCNLESLDAAQIQTLAQLELLDVSNNDISSLPAPLGLCENIKSLCLDGNSFKVPRVAIVAKGTSAVLEYLRSRIVGGNQ